MQTFAEWLDAQLAMRGWNAAALTRASQTPDNPRGIDSGLISRWRKPPPFGAVPTQAQTLSRLAYALGIPESEVYRAAGLGPADVEPLAQIDMRRQAVRDQLERWLAAVGPDYEQDFWDYLKAHGDSGAALFRRLRTAVSGVINPAVSDAVSEHPKRERKRPGGSNSALPLEQHTSRHPANSRRLNANALQAA